MHMHKVFDKPRHLSEIHAAPQELWPVFVEALLAQDWTVADTKAAKSDTILCQLFDRTYHLAAIHAARQEGRAAGVRAAGWAGTAYSDGMGAGGKGGHDN